MRPADGNGLLWSCSMLAVNNASPPACARRRAPKRSSPCDGSGRGRFRLVRQSLVEKVFSCSCRGWARPAVARWVWTCRRGLSMTADVGSIGREMTIDHTVMIFTLGVSVLAAVLFGLLPAVHQRPGSPLDAQRRCRAISQSKARHRTQSVLVTAFKSPWRWCSLIASRSFPSQDFSNRVQRRWFSELNEIRFDSKDLPFGTRDTKIPPSRRPSSGSYPAPRALPGVIRRRASTLPRDTSASVTFSIEGVPCCVTTERARRLISR